MEHRAQQHHDGTGNGHSVAATATHATLHCLLGCSVGELVGLAVGVALGFPIWATMSLDTALAVVFGMGLAAIPVMRNEGVGTVAAIRMIWVGELVSIVVMEVVMNYVDYLFGGIGTTSIVSKTFWIGFLVAIPPGFIAAWPVNYWMLARGIKTHH